MFSNVTVGYERFQRTAGCITRTVIDTLATISLRATTGQPHVRAFPRSPLNHDASRPLRFPTETLKAPLVHRNSRLRRRTLVALLSSTPGTSIHHVGWQSSKLSGSRDQAEEEVNLIAELLKSTEILVIRSQTSINHVQYCTQYL